MAGLTAVPRIRALACGNYSTGVIGSDDTAYLLGRWDGISEKTAVVRCLSTSKTPLPCPIPDSHPLCTPRGTCRAACTTASCKY